MKILALTARSATVELDGSSPYYRPSQFVIYLNGEEVRSEKRNVFSLFGLQPCTEYKIESRRSNRRI
ncbi:MAG: hypothetical protein K2L72_03370 [Clostridia bacterium]|nr:hypothetical protein [Clostridia bacterium]